MARQRARKSRPSSAAGQGKKTGRRRRTRSAAAIPSIEKGVTTIADVVALRGRNAPAALVDRAARKIYVSPRHREGVRRFLGADVRPDGVWVVTQPRLKGRYEAVPLRRLNGDGLFSVGLACIGHGYTCKRLRRDDCVNVYDYKTGVFLYSFKVSTMKEDICIKEGSDYCGKWWTTKSRNIYPNPNCSGLSSSSRTTILTC